MKSIIIIIALFLVTLTTKADWVKKNGLEQIQLPDSNFFFTKVNESCTKILLVSQKNLKLYIVDLASGKVEREQKIPNNFNICDYDFELESFVFSELPYKPIYKLNKLDSLDQFVNPIKVDGQNILNAQVLSFVVYNKNMHTKISVAYHEGRGNVKVYNDYRTYYNLDTKNVSNAQYVIENSTLFQDGLLIDNNGKRYILNSKGIVNIQNWFTKVLDINGNFISWQVNSLIINYSEVSTGKILNISTKDNTNKIDTNDKSFVVQIKNYKLIDNLSKAVFFKNSDTMYVIDNYIGLIIDTVNFVNGKLYLNNDEGALYSLKYDRLYRTLINQYKGPNDEILINQSHFLFDDSIKLFKTDISYYKNYFWKVDGKIFIDEAPKLQIRRIGTYDVSFNYIEFGDTITIEKKNLILVVDSLKYQSKVTSNDLYKIGTPVYFEVESNYPDAEFKWNISKCVSFDNGKGTTTQLETTTNTSKTFSTYFGNIGTNNCELIVKNKYQYIRKDFTVQSNPNVTLTLDKYMGYAPLEVTIKGIIACNTCFGFYEFPNSLNLSQGTIDIGDLKLYNIKDAKINIKHIFTKPGIYKIVSQCRTTTTNNPPVTHDSVLTVLAPTDIQDFAEKKYIFKQDADGIYCQLEGEGEVALYDNVGRLVSTYQIENERYIRKEDLERGVYLLSIQTGGNVYHEKVLVE